MFAAQYVDQQTILPKSAGMKNVAQIFLFWAIQRHGLAPAFS